MAEELTMASTHPMQDRRRQALCAALACALLAALLAHQRPALAQAPVCQVTYTIANQWSIGFTADVRQTSERPHGSDVFHDVEPEDLIKFGLIPEFVGRLPVVATLDELDEAALVSILLEPKNALSKQYRKLFDMEGVELEFRTDALKAVAKKAMQRKTGARGLRTILENVLLETMYELPSLRNVQKVVVDEQVILGESKPYVLYGNSDEGRLTAVEERRPTGSDH